MGTKTTTALAQLVTGLAALWIAYVQYQKQQTPNNPLFWSIFFLFTSALLIDKIGLVFSNYSLENDEKDLKMRIERQPSLFAGRHDVVAFINDSEGMKYCAAVVTLAISVKNTVLRYKSFGPESLEEHQSDAYDAWLAFKVKSIKESRCTWTEIVSTKLGGNALPKAQYLDGQSSSSRFYSYRSLDEDNHPMIQMTLFQLANGTKELVFGWEFPGVPHGSCFLTRNEEIISYFDKYFDHFWTMAEESKVGK
jgi:hypothetical protein